MSHEHQEPTPNKKRSDFWLSLEQFNNDPEFAKRTEKEFMSSPLQSEDGEDGVARREFLKLMGASIVMAGASGCIRRPIQKIIPYVKAPVEITPGEPTYYVSSWMDGQEAYATLVKTLDGRPIKVEGNPDFPINAGALSARAHGALLSVYDPDRLRGPKRNLLNKERTNRETVAATFDVADAAIVPQLKKGGVAIVTGPYCSVSGQKLIGSVKSLFSADHIRLDSMPTGSSVAPRLRLDRAKMIVTIDADILGTYLSPVSHMKGWSKGRKPGKDQNRMVAFESMMTVTGMNADDRYPIKPSQQFEIACALLNEVQKDGRLAPYADAWKKAGIPEAAWKSIVADLQANRGRSLVVAGGLQTLTAEQAALQSVVGAINSALGNDGKTIDNRGHNHKGGTAGVAALIAGLKAGKYKTVIFHGTNPIYWLPSHLGFSALLAKAEMVISTSNFMDETAQAAHYVLPSGTTYETWNDHEFVDGLISIQQPTLRHLYEGRSFEDSLLTWAKSGGTKDQALIKANNFYEYIQSVWQSTYFGKYKKGGQDFQEFWNGVLQTGFVGEANDRDSGARGGKLDIPSVRPTRKGRFELVLYPTVQLADGELANVPWLQELPDPVTKVVWDNYLCVSPATAEREHLKRGSIVELEVEGVKMEVPVLIQPGLHDEVLALAVGYGRTAAGKVGNGIGHNAYRLAKFDNGQFVFSGLGAEIKKTHHALYELVSTQEHHSMEGRQIIVETTKKAFEKDEGAGIHRHQIFSIWPAHQYNTNKWAMSIDLNSCTGCSACVIACQAENNIPVVGKRYVMQGREMHWIRIDRYFKGDPKNPDAIVQPMLCHHCETAPCETVCPVMATVHNDEGLNDMIYNRCVGTRYCSNNCPYKVRRFNWFNYSKRPEPSHMALNPDVTVRARGVMEKCTFCVQRIRHGTNEAKDHGQKVKDGAIKTACEQTCPTNAIVFGDLNDPESRVTKLFQSKRTYSVLEEFNTQPRVRYMTRVRNAERVDVAHAGGAGHGGGHAEQGAPMKEQHKKDGHAEGHGGHS